MNNNASAETEKLQALYRAVISQAITDATIVTNDRRFDLDRKQAVTWLTGNSRDFIEVCALADLDPAQVRLFAIRQIEESKAVRPKVRSQRAKPQTRSASVTLTHDGLTLSLQEWATRTGINYRTICSRISYGWSAERTLTTAALPPFHRRKSELTSARGVGRDFAETLGTGGGCSARDLHELEISQ